MSPELAAAGVALAAVMLYAMFGGADFGGGIWSLLAWGPRKQEQRLALEKAIGPVWETNHVWLILLVVTLFVVFPTAYAVIFEALYVPLFIALLGIVARGAAFAFRHYGQRESRLARQSLQWFSWASVATPFTFGLVIGAVTGGHIKVDGSRVLSGPFAGWLGPFALMCGLIGLLTCAFLAAAYMVPRTEGALQEDFRRRAIAASLALGVATTVAIPVAAADADAFASHLDDARVVAAMAATALLGLAALWALWTRRARLAPPLAAATVAGVVGAWGLAQHPYLLANALTYREAAAERITVVSFLVALPIGSLILVPSLWLLYWTFSRDTLRGEEIAH
ncbi:cytochrome d ubiquinol oxidase subunit II [Tepidiforma bonchosmolovskayae]|uniref:Cytochrome d ubiquinol oxidase subunit II n=1 Tax=Tepidiforma bonchosmolovskayae TaxID=2601677 RepID=A0ABX6C5E3_9CHLR|nr:cytochrome d ubiquinol oxidase subunit II [Tepidiforma bonchosmolovskayae]QFG03214.1 cytochrome d ubiquinol oxidase subunit II [Tepidiforma bonchosmolovskayae]